MNKTTFAFSKENKVQKGKDTKLKQILTDLRASDDKLVAHAIKSLEVHGNSSVIGPLCDRLLQPLSETNRTNVLELLCSLKDSTARTEIMDALSNPKYIEIRRDLLQAVWNMKVDFSDYVAEFVEIAVNGDFMDSLDCLTILENMEGPFLEEDILEAQLHLKNYLESDKRADAQKAQMLSEIALKVKEFNMGLMD